MRRMNPNQPPMATMSSGGMPMAGAKPPRQVRPMSNTTATKPTGGQPEGQVHRPNRQPANLPPRQGQVRPMAGGLMGQQNTLSKREPMPPSKGQQQQGDPRMDRALQQSQARWDWQDGDLYGSTGGTLRPERLQGRSEGRPMSSGLMKIQTGNANDVAPQMMAQNQSNPTAGATGTLRPERLQGRSEGRPMSSGLMKIQTGNANDVAPQMMAQNQSNPTAGATGAAGPSAVGASPANRPVVIKPPSMGFDADTMTVEGRLQGLMASDNPIMQQARLQAQQQSASRGLQNSSMAVQSGQQAAYASMMPIASQDATTAYDQEKTEYSTRADSALMDQDYQNSRGLAEQGFGYDSSLMDQDIAGKKSIQLDRFGQETSLQAQDITGRKDLQTDAQKAQTARDATKFTTDTSLQAQGIEGQQTLQTDAQKAQTARDATKFTTDTSLQAQGIAGQKDLQSTQIRSAEKIAADRNATSIQTTQIGASAQLASASINAAAATAVASANNAAAAARQETQLQGQTMLNAQQQSYQQSNMDQNFINEQTLQTERVNAETDKYQQTLDSQHQLSYAGGITNLQLGTQNEHSAIAQNPEMNPTEKQEAHADVDTRFKTDSTLQAAIYGFGD